MNYYFRWDVVWASAPQFARGLLLGVAMALVSLVVGMALGLGVAYLNERSRQRWVRPLTAAYVAVLRNTPLLVLIFIAYFGLPSVGIRMGKVNSFMATLTLYACAYMIEVFRAGLRAVPRGYIEAAKATGLGQRAIFLKVEFPLMIRNVLPSLSNYLISLFKDTALASAITVPELTYFATKLTTEQFRIFEAWFLGAVFYLAMCLLLSFGLRRVENRVQVAQ